MSGFGALRHVLGPYRSPNGVTYNGSSSTTIRGSQLTGLSTDQSKFIHSYWWRFNADGGTNQYHVATYSGGGGFYGSGFNSTTNRVFYFGGDTGFSNSFGVESTATFVPTTEWVHVLLAVDTQGSATPGVSPVCKIYINDVNSPIVITGGGGIAFNVVTSASTNWSIGYYGFDGTQTTDGQVAEFFMDMGTYYDLDDPSIRRKFIDGRKRPVNLGGFGERPFGTQPYVYLNGTASVWGINRGKGGDFSTSNLADFVTSPSDGF